MTLFEALTVDGSDIPAYEEAEQKLVLSLTGDVLSFRRCARQYGMQKSRGYVPARATQEFVGTFAHRALDRAVRWHRETGAAPDDGEMVSILGEVRDVLRQQRRRPHSWNAVEHVGYRVMRLNRTFAERGVYDLIVDTERGLRTDQGRFVLEGRVDVIQRAGGVLELWDYKATQDPRRFLGASGAGQKMRIARNSAGARLKDYELQLRLYAHLHEKVYGLRPASCRAVFLNEVRIPDLPKGTAWSEYAERGARGMSDVEWSTAEARVLGDEPGLYLGVDLDGAQVEEAVTGFSETAEEILACRRADFWPPPEVVALPDAGTCDACDFRWSCKPASEVYGYQRRL